MTSSVAFLCFLYRSFAFFLAEMHCFVNVAWQEIGSEGMMGDVAQSILVTWLASGMWIPPLMNVCARRQQILNWPNLLLSVHDFRPSQDMSVCLGKKCDSRERFRNALR